jgi:hypothetical protein
VKRSTRVEKLAKVAKDNAFALAGLAAKSRQDAAVELYRTAALITEWLTFLCCKNPALFRAIARNKLSWPVMFSPGRKSVEHDIELTKKLELAKNTGINISSNRTFSWGPAHVVVFNLYQLAQDLERAPTGVWCGFDSIAGCGIGWKSPNEHHYDVKYEKQLKALEEWGQGRAGRCLPPLSRETAPQWWTAIKELFEIAYPGDFEQHPKLQWLRTLVLPHAAPKHAKQGRPGDIRAAMLRKVKQALNTIAALD